MTEDQAINLCTKAVKGLEQQKDFWFIARSKQDIAPIGCICLLLSEDPSVGEVGYWVSGDKQGQGFATEMLQAMIGFAFGDGSLSKLVATAAIENPISLRVLEKQGFQIIGRKDLPTVKNTMLTCHLLSLINPEV